MALNVGQLKQMLEFIDDKTKVYIESDINGDFKKVRRAQFEFLVEGATSGRRLLADPDESVDNEIGLVMW